MKCPTCNFENGSDSKFCCGCGRPIPYCPTCGNVLTTRDRFCIHDGTRLPDELLMLVPEEEVVEQVDVVQHAAPVVTPLVETIQIPVKKTPNAYCLRCGSPIWQGEDYCAGCRSEMNRAKPACASCGMACEPGEEYCSYCRPTDPIPVANMDYIPERTQNRLAKPQKKKKGSAFTAILVIFLLLLIGAAAVLVAAEFDLIELPDFFGSEDSGSDRDRDRDRDDKDDDTDVDKPGDGNQNPDTIDPTGDGAIQATTAPPETTAPPTTEPTETQPKPTEPPQTKLEYFMENCDSVVFSEEDIAGFTEEEARYARNACYAQGGRKFKDKSLQAYFEEYAWYSPTYEPAYFDQHEGDLMNYYMKENLKLIRTYEKEMGFG